MRAIRREKNAGAAAAEFEALDFFSLGGVEDDEVAGAEIGNEDAFAVESEFEAIGHAAGDGECLDKFFGGDVDDGDGGVAGVGGPKFCAVGGEVETFRAVADGDGGDVPIFLIGVGRRRGARRRAGRSTESGDGLVDDGDGIGVDVGGEDAREIAGDVEHVGAILADAENPIDFHSGGIDTADELVGFGGEIKFAAGKIETVGTANGAEVNGRQSFLCNEVDDGDGVERALEAAVVGDES